MEITVPVRDHYGNEWRLTPSGQLEVMAPGAVGVVVWEQLGSPAQSVATDDHGFVWLVAGGEVATLYNPPRCGRRGSEGDQKPGARTLCTAFEKWARRGRNLGRFL